MINVNFKKTCMLSFLILIILIMMVWITMQSIQYTQVKKLCQEIQDGKEIRTDIGNATTAPLFFDNFAVIMQIKGVKIPLVEACYYRNVQAVEILLKNGADPNFYIEGRWSPMEAALICGPVDEKSVEIVKLLAEHGADVDAHASNLSVLERLTQGMSLGATNEVSEQIFKCLVENGADIACESGGTVLRYLIRGGDIELADWLIEKRTLDVNESGYAGMTPLMLVVSLASDEVLQATVDWLLDHGADVSAKDDFGKTAYDYAMEQGRVEIAELLR